MPHKCVEKRKQYKRKWHLKNKEKLRRNRNAERRAWLAGIKDAPCVDCGVKYPPVAMQFDHVKDNKIAGVSKILKDKGKAAAIREIQKCVLVCANCHAIRTQNRYLVV